jgi:hypothetical protein
MLWSTIRTCRFRIKKIRNGDAREGTVLGIIVSKVLKIRNCNESKEIY